MRELTYSEAIREGLAEEMARDDRVFVFGQDVVLGYIFNVTKGLVDRFGPERVLDTPISEAVIAGAAIGSALAGDRPVAEIQVGDFVTLAMDQLVNQAAKLRYMTGGQVGEAGEAQEADDQVVKTGHHVAGAALGEARGVLAEGDIAAIVQAILDTPVGTRQFEESRRRGLGRGKAGQPIDDLVLVLAGLALDPLSLQPEDLLQPWPVGVAFEFGADGELADLSAAIDGTSEDRPDTPENARAFGRPGGKRGDGAFPQAKGVYLLECGTHAIVDAGFWPCRTGEDRGARRLLRSLTEGMLLMWDTGLHSFDLAQATRARDAHFLGRVPVLK